MQRHQAMARNKIKKVTVFGASLNSLYSRYNLKFLILYEKAGFDRLETDL